MMVTQLWLDIARETAWNNGCYDESLMEEIAQSGGFTVNQLIAALEKEH